MAELGLVEVPDDQIHATDLLRALMDARGETAIAAFGDQNDTIDEVLDTCQILSIDAEGALLDYTRHVPEPGHRGARLLHRLMKVRYVRHHCHMVAWESAGLLPTEMPPLTSLWNGETTDPSEALSLLVNKGLATSPPDSTLTDTGRDVRDKIELDTNTGTQAAFDAAATTQTQNRFLAALASLELRI
jgi:hypothetical protein